MAERLAYLEAVVGADITQFRKGMRDIRNETGLFSETMRGLAGIGRTLTFAFTAPMVALGSMAAQSASKFDGALRNINAIAGLTEEQLASLSAQTLEFGKTTRGGAVQAAESLYTVFSAGLLDTEKAFTTMEIATKTAEAGLADMNITTEALVATMLSYGDTSETMALQASDALTQMVAVGVGSMQSFATAIGRVLPSASAAGMEINELFGDMAFLTQRGLTAAASSTALNAALEQLIKPTEVMQKAFKSLGADSLPELVDEFGSINSVIAELIEYADGDLELLFSMFNSRQARRAISQFAGDVEGWGAAMAEFEAGVDGATDRAYEQQMLSFGAAWDLMTSAIEAAAITIGNAILPLLRPFVEAITDIALGITEINPNIMQFGVLLTGVAAVIPPLLWGLTSLASPIGVLVAGAALLSTTIGADLIAGFADFFGSTDKFKTELQDLSEIIENITGWDFMEDDDTTDDWGDMIPTMDKIMSIDPFENIIVERPTSLYEIYEEHGYDELFSWKGFMREMVERGWDGNAILPETKITFPDGRINNEDALATVNRQMQELDEAFNRPPPPIDGWMAGLQENTYTMSDRIRDMWPEFSTAFNSVWNSIVTWIDGKATEIVNSFTSWFDSASMQPLYDAAQLALSGDFTGAIDRIFPGVSEKVGGFFSDLFGLNSELQIGGALLELGKSAGDFMLTKFIPGVMQITGLVIGKLGTLLFNIISGAFTSVGDGSAGDLVSAVATFIDTSIVSPLVSGFEDAISGTALEGFLEDVQLKIETVKNLISTGFETLNIDDAWAGVVDLMTGIGNGLKHMADADWSGVAKLGGFVLVVGGHLFQTAMGFLGGLGSGLGSLIETIGHGIGALVNALAAAANGDIAGVGQQLLTFFIDLGAGIIQFPLAIVQGIAQAVLDFFGIDFTLPNFAEEVTKWKDELITNITTPPDTPPDLGWGEAGFGSEAGEALLAKGLQAQMETWLMGDSFDFEITNGELIVDWDSFDISAFPDEQIEGLADEIANWDAVLGLEGGLYQPFYDMFKDIEGVDIMKPLKDKLAEEGMEIDVPLVKLTGGGAGATPDPESVAAVTETLDNVVGTAVDNYTVDPEVMKSFGSSLSTVMTSGMGTDAEGNITAAPIIDDFLKPMEAEWIRLFGDSGTMAVAYGLYTDSVVEDTAEITTALTDLNTFVGGEFQSFDDNFISATSGLLTQLEWINDEIDEALDGIKKILEAAGGTISVEINVGNTPGGYKTGLWEVPSDNFLANLHAGEMVVPKDEADMLRDGAVPTNLVTGGIRDTGGSTTKNVIQINGVQNVDRLLFELERRGIKLK